MIHKTQIDKYNGSLQELVEDIGNLRYDTLELFLIALSKKINDDGEKDFKRGRYRLASHLKEGSKHLEMAADQIKLAWRICEPFTK